MRILSMGDNPKTSTGYGCVWDNLLSNWKKLKPDWEFLHIGWQNRDRPHETKEGYVMLPMGNLEYGYDVTYPNLMKYKPDIFITLCDVGWQSGYIEHVQKAKQDGWKGKWIAYTPIDSHYWAMTWDEILRQPDVNVAMAKFGEEMMKQQKVPNVRRIDHGVDLDTFKPINRNELREKYKVSDKFVVGFVGRNQQRKMLDRVLIGFTEFAKDKEDVILMLHTDAEPPMAGGWSLRYWQWKLKIEGKLRLTKPNLDIIGRQRIDTNNMNEIYNMMDVFCYGTGGEGFGLPGIECQASGVPLLMTDCSTALDLCRDENKIKVLKDSYGRDVVIWGTNGVGFKVPDDVHMVELLNKMYKEWKEGKLIERSKEAREFSEKYDWKIIAKQWVDLFDQEA